MTTIDRRRFVATLGAAAALPMMSVATGAACAPAQAAGTTPTRPTETTCFLSYSYGACVEDGGIDFWSRLVHDANHDRWLLPQIGRGWMFHEPAQAMSENDPDARRCFAARVPDGRLAAEIKALVEHRPVGPRTALVALDSLGPCEEPDWADVLPAFRAGYERVIGHFHLECSGLRQWKAWLDDIFPERDGKSFFQTFFLDAAAQCDAVILTSRTVADLGLRRLSRASTTKLLRARWRRLGHALLDRRVVECLAQANSDSSAGGLRPVHFGRPRSLLSANSAIG